MKPGVEDVRDHYEKYPYPDYPLFAMGRWKQLEQVDLHLWGVREPKPELWIAGCGTIAPLMFARRNPRAKILATDLAKKSIQRARTRCWLMGYHQVQFLQQDLLSAEFENRFDAVDAYGVIHHTPDPVEALKTLAKSLKLGGFLRLMLYSKRARAELEKYRAKYRAEQISLRNLAADLPVELKTNYLELQNLSGMADALLHPLVHVYDDSSLNELLKNVPGLKLISRKAEGNYLLFLERTI